jgi:hypothetical protein
MNITDGTKGIAYKANIRFSTEAAVHQETDDHTILVDATSAAAVLWLRQAEEGRVICLKKVDSSANAITIQSSAGETINSAATLTLSGPGQSVTLQGRDGSWVVISEQTTLTAPSVTVANHATPNGNAYITLQAVDAQGNALAKRVLFKVWLAATAHAAPADLGTLTATTGTILKEDTDDALATVASDANGTAVLVLDVATTSAIHAMAECNGMVGTSSVSVTAVP